MTETLLVSNIRLGYSCIYFTGNGLIDLEHPPPSIIILFKVHPQSFTDLSRNDPRLFIHSFNNLQKGAKLIQETERGMRLAAELFPSEQAGPPPPPDVQSM